MENPKKDFEELDLEDGVKAKVPAYFNCTRVFDVMEDEDKKENTEIDEMYIARANSVYKTSTFYTYGFQKPISKIIGLKDIFDSNEK